MRFKLLFLMLTAVLSFSLPTFGQQEKVRLVYFYPNDRYPGGHPTAEQKAVVKKQLDTLIKKVKEFFKGQVVGGKTFDFEKDENGTAIVYYFPGKNNSHNYRRGGNLYSREIRDEISAVGDQLAIEMSNYLYLIAADLNTPSLSNLKCGGASYLTELSSWLFWTREVDSPWAVVDVSETCFYSIEQRDLDEQVWKRRVWITAHELGHAFGLQHDWSNPNYTMSYGRTPHPNGTFSLPTRLSSCAARWLQHNKFFNTDPQITPLDQEAEIIPTSAVYSPSTEILHLKIVATDADGLREAQLLVGSGIELQGCKSLNSPSEEIEFDISKADLDKIKDAHEIRLQVIDGYGYIIRKKLQLVVAAGSIDAQTLTVDDSPRTLDVSDNFQNLDNGRLRYTASSDNTRVATVRTSVSGSRVTITPQHVGSTFVTVTASNGKFTAVQRISVSVVAAPIASGSNNEINIPDPYLRAKIERALDKRAGDSITAAEMATLTTLNARNSHISNLTGLKFATNLTSLNLYNNRLVTLPTGVFEGLNKVTTLYLSSNPLETIKTGAFNGLSSLTELVLRNMRVKTIEGDAFNGLTNLRSLNLYNNHIYTLQTGVFAGLSKVTTLHLTSNPLTTIKTGAFNGLSSLTELVLRNMRVKTIEGDAFNGLTNLRSLNLYNNHIYTLQTGVFAGLSKVTTLHLTSNPLTTIKTGAFNGLSSLTELDLRNMRVKTIEGGAFNGLTNLRSLNLYNNHIYTLQTGVFAGLSNLQSLSLNSNPGTRFTLVIELARMDTIDRAAPGPATVVVQLAQGAPFEMAVNLSVEGGTLSANTAAITKGKVQSDPITMTQSGTRPATVSLETVPRVPSGYSGIRMAVGDSFSTGSILPHSMVKISGDNQQGPAGATLEEPLIVEVRDVTNRGLEGVDVKFAVTAGDGTVSEITVTTDANGQAASWFTLGGQPGMHTVQASVEGLSQTAVFNATIESMEFDFSVPSGTSLIHVPLRVTAVDGVAQSIESISDLYNALGGVSTVNFLLTYDPTTQDWLSYFGTFDTGRAADKVLTDDTGILAGMRVPVLVRLRGNALGINRNSTITLNQGPNVVGLPLRDSRIVRVSDLLALEGIGGNVPVVILNDNGEFKTVGRAGDPGDIPITGGQGFILTAQRAATVAISGEGWTNVLGTTAAPPVTLKGIGVGDTTPVLGLRGSIAGEGTGLKVEGFRVTVKNLSTGRAISGITGGERGGYQLNVVDTETGRAATIGDILEISAQSRDPLIGVQPLQYTVTAEDVNRSRIQLETLVAYEIPAETELLPNYPNPFNPETWIPYRLAEDASVTMAIYDQSGRVVRMLDVGYRVAAVYESRSKAIYWDGRNRFGEPVASGVYFYHLSAGDYSATRRMVIIK